MGKLSAAVSSTAGLVQESTVEIGDREVLVVTRVLTHPEVLIVNEVCLGDRTLKKQHIPAPSVTVRQYEQHGEGALAPLLLSSHLRFVRRLLTANDASSETASQKIPAGVVSVLILGDDGQVISSVGEEHVPGGWLRATYLIEALTKRAAESFAWGPLEAVVVEGAGVSAVMRRKAGRTAVCFLHDDRPSPEHEEGIRKHLEELLCAAR